MVAAYLRSAFEKALLSEIESMDRSVPDYYVKSPLLINCRGDAKTFDAQVTERQRDWIVRDFASGRLTSVSGLTRPSYLYARAQLRERRTLLSDEGVRALTDFLAEWRGEHCRKDYQPGKVVRNLCSHTDLAGIDIILPTGTRLPYDWFNLRGFQVF